MDTPQGLLEAKVPGYVTNLNKGGEIDFRDRKVEMCNPFFLGARFKKNSKHPVAGINVTLGERCKRAQIALYALAYLEVSKKATEDGKTPPAELDEDAFTKWCWVGQNPFDPGATPLKIPEHSGVADRPGGNSKHASGSAMDLNVMGNPWMPVRQKNGALGGEVHKEDTKAFTGNLLELHREKIWKPAMVIFDRAHRMFRGTPAELHADTTIANAESMYKRFKDLSNCLETYFRYGFHSFPEKPASQRRKAFGVFREAVLLDRAEGVLHADAQHIDGDRLLPLLDGPDADATLQALFDQIAKDYAFLPFAIVSGTLKSDAEGNLSLPSRAQRDPTAGTFNIRNEVFMELVVNQKLRWGGTMFTNNGGDNMHFDLGTHIVDGEAIP